MRRPATASDRAGAVALGLLVVLSMLAPCLALAADHDASSTPDVSALSDVSAAALGGAHRVLQGDGLVRVEPLGIVRSPEAGAPPPVASGPRAASPCGDVAGAPVERSPVRRF